MLINITSYVWLVINSFISMFLVNINLVVSFMCALKFAFYIAYTKLYEYQVNDLKLASYKLIYIYNICAAYRVKKESSNSSKWNASKEE